MLNAGTVLTNLQRRHRSSFASDLHSIIFGEFNNSGAERVVRDFEKHNSSNSVALSEYVKALVSLELQTNKGSHRFLSEVTFKLHFLFPCINDVCVVALLLVLRCQAN